LYDANSLRRHLNVKPINLKPFEDQEPSDQAFCNQPTAPPDCGISIFLRGGVRNQVFLSDGVEGLIHHAASTGHGRI
jgi:hypothetical protein